MEGTQSASYTAVLGRRHSLSLQEADHSPPSCAKFTIKGALPPDPIHLHGMCFSPRLNYFAYYFIWLNDIKILKYKHCSCNNTHCYKHWVLTMYLWQRLIKADNTIENSPPPAAPVRPEMFSCSCVEPILSNQPRSLWASVMSGLTCKTLDCSSETLFPPPYSLIRPFLTAKTG